MINDLGEPIRGEQTFAKLKAKEKARRAAVVMGQGVDTSPADVKLSNAAVAKLRGSSSLSIAAIAICTVGALVAAWYFFVRQQVPEAERGNKEEHAETNYV